MNVQELQTMQAYQRWASQKLWNCLEQLSDAQFDTDLHYSMGSLRNQVAHTIDVEGWWIKYLHTSELRFGYAPLDGPRAELWSCWQSIMDATEAYLATLTPAELHREVHPEEGLPAIRVWQALLQVFNHATDHRAQMLAGLHKLGGPTFEQDYVYFLYDQTAA